MGTFCPKCGQAWGQRVHACLLPRLGSQGPQTQVSLAQGLLNMVVGGASLKDMGFCVSPRVRLLRYRGSGHGS